MPTSTPLPKVQRFPRVLARLGRAVRATPKRPGTAFDSADPHGLVQRLDDSDCFCRDTKIGRLYHSKDVSYREIVARDSLHLTLRDGRTVATHVDRHSPLARRQPGGACRYSPLRIAAHNVTGAARDLVRMARGKERGHGDEDPLIDDYAVSEALTVKERQGARPQSSASTSEDGSDLSDLRPHRARPVMGEAPRRGPR